MLPNTKPYFIAETAFHHEGDKDFLIQLIQNILKTDAHAIKFHLLFDISDYIIKDHPALEVIQKIAIPVEHWEEILGIVQDAGKDIILLCNDVSSMAWVNKQQKLKVKAIELHSTGLNDIFLLKEASRFNGTVILGVGGSTFDEVKYSIDFLKQNGQDDIFLMHGFQNYPTRYEEINLRRMSFLNSAFDLPVGYADHTDPQEEHNEFISTLPQAMGFNVLEKHVTNVFGTSRIDAQAAVSIETFQRIMSLANIAYMARGLVVMGFSESERKYGNTGPMKKAIVARTAISKGEKITMENIAFKRTELSAPLMQKDLDKLLNGVALNNIEGDEILSFGNVSYQFSSNSFDQFFINREQQ